MLNAAFHMRDLDTLVPRSLTDDSATMSITGFRDRSGFHVDHFDNNPIYEQLQEYVLHIPLINRVYIHKVVY